MARTIASHPGACCLGRRAGPRPRSSRSMQGAAFTCRARPASLCVALARAKAAPVEQYGLPPRRRHFYSDGNATTRCCRLAAVAARRSDHAVSTAGIRGTLPNAGDRPADAWSHKPGQTYGLGDFPAAFRPGNGSLSTVARRSSPVPSVGTPGARDGSGASPETSTLRRAGERPFGPANALALPRRGRLPSATCPWSTVAGARPRRAACVRLARPVRPVAASVGCGLAAPPRSLRLLDLGGVRTPCPMAGGRHQRGVLAMDRGDSFPRSGFGATAVGADPAGRREPGRYRAQR